MNVNNLLVICGMSVFFLGLLALPLTFIVRVIRKRRKDKLAGIPSAAQIKQREEDWRSFEAAEPVTTEELSNRPVSATLRKLIVGALIVSTTTYLGSLVPFESSSGSASSWPSFIGCAIGLWLVGTVVFGNGDPLDKRRWQHYWHGDLLGYWPTYILALFVLVRQVSGGGYHTQETLTVVDLGAYVAASVVGFFVGLLNVVRCDARDKREVVTLFREWQEGKLAG